jgi:calcineurin-like phosphoesterase family protein
MSEIFFTSDLHMMHNKGFLFEPRGFSNETDMCEALVENWNKIVKSEDTVYDLGDVALSDIQTATKYIKKLNGKHFLIRGNHDTDKKIEYLIDSCWNKFFYVGWADMLKYEKYHFYMSHYPTLTAKYDDKKFSQHVIALHGHTHQQTNWLQKDNPFLYHVGLDSHNCTPVHIDEMLADVRNRYNQFEGLYEKYKEDTYGEVK